MFKTDKILFICNSLVSKGGVENRTFEQMVYLRKKGCEVELIALRATGPVEHWFRENGFKVRCIPVYKSRLISSHPLKLLGLWLYIFKERFGVIVCVQAISHYVGRAACFPPLGRKIIAMERVDISGRSKMQCLLDYLCALWTSKIICVSKYVGRTLQKQARVPPAKISVIEDAATYVLDQPNQAVSLKRDLGGRIVFGTVSHCYPGKRLDFLIKAFAKLLNRSGGSDVLPALVILGDGPEKQSLMALVQELALQDAVFFTGSVDYPHNYYQLFDIFVFTTISEGCGTACYEAMVHRLPVICTRIQPFVDYIEDGKCGLLFDPDHMGDLVEKMMQLRDDPKLRDSLGINACRMAQKRFDAEILLARFHRELSA